MHCRPSAEAEANKPRRCGADRPTQSAWTVIARTR